MKTAKEIQVLIDAIVNRGKTTVQSNEEKNADALRINVLKWVLGEID